MIANKISLIISRINGLDEMLSEDECLFVDSYIYDWITASRMAEDMNRMFSTLFK